MAFNDDVDAVITGSLSYSGNNTVSDGAPLTPGGPATARPMTRLEALSIGTVRLAKRYATQLSIPERPVLAALINRLNDRLNAMDKAQANAEATVAAASAAAVRTEFNKITLPE